MKLLIMFSFIDYLLGLMTVLIKGSTSKGVLSSKVMGAGIAKKVCYITLSFVAYVIDSKMGVTGMYNFVTIGFIIAEGISILETCRTCGVTCEPLERYFNEEKNKREEK